VYPQVSKMPPSGPVTVNERVPAPVVVFTE